MKRFIICALASIIAYASVADNSTDNNQRVGLVLSGGGARGIAEIAVIKVLEENDIPIDYITGTSIGAIVGGLYAAGYSPDEMMQLVKSKMFLEASMGKISPEERYLFYTPTPSPTIFSMNFDAHTGKMAPLLPASLISPMPMNFSFMDIFAPYSAMCRGNFDNLFVPLRTIASDMTKKRAKVWSRGQLCDAVRSSMSFPLVFKPVVYEDSLLLYDGGIYDNFPVDVMRKDFDPSIMIGVDIHGTTDSTARKHFPDLIDQVSLLVMRPCSYELPDSDGIKLRINLNKFSLLDFDKADEIYRIGYEHALEMVDSIKERVTARRPAAEVARRRAEWRKQLPAVAFDSVKVSGGSPAVNSFIEYTFTSEAPQKDDGSSQPITLDQARDGYSRLLSTGQLYDLDPQAHFNDSTGNFMLSLKADVKPEINIGVGGYITSSTNSMLYISGGFRSLSFSSMDASLNAWLGQSYLAATLDTRMILRHSHPSAVGIQFVASRQKFYESDKLFYDFDSPAFISRFEGFGRISYGHATTRHSRLDAGVGLGHLNDRFFNNTGEYGSNAQRNKLTHNIAQVMVRWEYNTLDNQSMPTAGQYFGIMVQADYARFHHNEAPAEPGQSDVFGRWLVSNYPQKGSDRWLQVEAAYKGYFPVTRHFIVGVSSSVVASTRHLMECYNANMVFAPSFRPTPASYNTYNPYLVANSYVTAGIEPIYKFGEFLSIRGSFHAFSPMREITTDAAGKACYESKWFNHVRFFGEVSGVVTLPIGNLSVYANYQTAPVDRWGVGVSFGYFFLAPRMLRL